MGAAGRYAATRTARLWRYGISATTYGVAGRSLLLFVLQPYRTRDRSTAAERSFQRVFQAMDDASTKSVRFGFD